MRIFSWRQLVDRILTWWCGRTPQNRKRREFTRLSLRRLEERRVLNGAPISVGVTIEDMKGAVVVDVHQSGAPGAAHTGHDFNVSIDARHGQIELELTDHGTILYEAEFNKIKSLTFNATGHDNTLTVDFSHGNPIPQGGLLFIDAGPMSAGAAGDSLHIINGSANSVGYVFDNAAGGRVSIAAGSQNSAINFSASSMHVQDELTAATRSFAVGAGISQVRLSQDELAAGMSQLGLAAGATVDFQNPSNSLSVNVDSSAAATVDVNGLGTGLSANVSISAGASATVDVTGPTNLGAGSLSISAGTIQVDGPVQTAGGTIELSASRSIIVAPGGELATRAAAIDLSAPSITMQGTIVSTDGGSVRLSAGADGTLIDSGKIDVSGLVQGEHGGSVDLLGKDVGLTGHAVVNASGAAGGGSVRIGGDYHDGNAAILDATQTYVGSQTVINADAVDLGNGGRVVVWSNELTSYYGSISARGGEAGGDGGFAEVSSRQNLSYSGNVDLSAARGNSGLLLLDPDVIIITHGNNGTGLNDGQVNADGSVLFNDGGAPPAKQVFTITDGAILAANANITLEAYTSIKTDNSSGAVNLTLAGSHTLTLITANTTADGVIDLSNATAFGTTNGKITISAATGGTFRGDVTIGTMSSGGQDIAITTANGNITLAAALNAGGGKVTLTANSVSAGSGILTVTPTGAVATSGGNVSIAAADVHFNGAVDAGAAGSVSLQSVAPETIGLGNAAGDMTIDGSELANIQAKNLTVGGAATKSITVDGVGANQSAGIGTLTLQALQNPGSIRFTGAASTFGGLTAVAHDGINLSGSVTVTGAVNMTADADGTATGLFTVGNGATLDTTGNPLTIIAHDLALTGHLTTGTGTATITSKLPETIGVGNAAGDLTIDGSELANIQAKNLIIGASATKSVVVDGVTSLQSANIGTLTFQALQSQGSVSFTGAASAFKALSAIAVDGVTMSTNVTANGPVVISSDVDASGTGLFMVGNGATLDTTGNPVTIIAQDVTLAGHLTSGTGTTTITSRQFETIGVGNAVGDLTIDGSELANIQAKNLIIGASATKSATVDGVTPLQSANIAAMTVQALQNLGSTITFTGADSTFSALTALANAGVTMNCNITTSGPIIVNADADAFGAGLFTVGSGAIVDTSGKSLSITAQDVSLAGKLNCAAASITTRQVETIGMGNATGDMTIDGGELANIHCTSLTVGGSATKSLTVDGVMSLQSANLGTLFLQALQPDGNISFQGSTSKFSSLIANANDGITLTGSVTTTGAITFNADADGTGSGLFTVASGATMDTSGKGLTITAQDVTLAGHLNSGVGTTTITTKQVETIGIGNAVGDLTIDGNELANIQATNLTVGNAATKSITVDGVTSGQIAGIGTLLLQAFQNTGSISFTGSASSFKALTANANDGVTLTASVTTHGATNFNADANGAGTGLFTVANGATVNTNGSGLTITAQDATLDGKLNSGAAATKIKTQQNETIGLGLATGDLTLTEAELQNITSNSLTIGDVHATSIVSDTVTTGVQQGAVTLSAGAAGGNLSFVHGDSSFLSLNATAQHDITFDPGRTITATAGSLVFNAGGAMAGSGDLTLQATNGVTLNGNLSTNTSTNGSGLTVNADTDAAATGLFTLAGGANVNTNSNALTITAQNVALNGTLNSGNTTTTIKSKQAETIGVGNAVGNLTITGAELQNITAQNLVIGDPLAGSTTTTSITVDGVTSTQSSKIGLISLNALSSSGSISFVNNDSTFQSLMAIAHKNITFDSGRTISASAGSIALQAQTGTISDTGSLSLEATSGVTIGSSLNTGTGGVNTGALTVNADTDADGTGKFMIAGGAKVTTNSSSLSITAADVTLAGTLNSGNAATTIQASADETIGLGTGAAGTISLDNSALANITSGALIVGGANTGTITVNGFTGTTQGPVTLHALAAGADVVFSGAASTFAAAASGQNAILAIAAHDINVNAAISTNPAGDVYLDAKQNLTIGDTVGNMGSITTAGASGGTLTVIGGIVVHDVTVGAGNVTLIAEGSQVDLIVHNSTSSTSIVLKAPRDIIVEGTVQTTDPSADITLIADENHTGTGGVWITAIGNLISDGNIFISGSNLFNRSLAGGFTPNLPVAVPLSIEVAGNSNVIPTNSIVAAGNITIESSGAAPAGAAIDLQGVVQSTGAGNISLTAAQLASQYVIQTNSTIESNGGNISVDSPVILTGTTTLTTTGAGGINFNAGAAAPVPNATIDSLDSTPQALNMTAGTGGITLSAAVGAKHAVGAITANAANGVTFNANVATNAALSVNADTGGTGTGLFRVASGVTVDTSGHGLTITAQDVDLQGNLQAVGATTTIATQQDETIGLGNAVGNLTLSEAELQNITSGGLTIGGIHTTSITSDSVTTGAQQGPVTLSAGASVGNLSFVNGDSSFLSLNATAQNNITFDAGRTITATGGSLIFTAGGALSDTGDLTLLATDGVTLNSNLSTNTVTAGNGLAVNADADGAGTGLFTVGNGVKVTTNSNALSITAQDVTLTGTLNSGTATTTITTQQNETIGLGLATGDLTLDGGELQNITAQTLVLGSGLTTLITVDGVTQLQSANIGLVSLNALTNAGHISFATDPSTFQSLTASANDGISVQQNQTTVAGGLTLNGDANNTGDTLDSIVFAPGITLTSAAGITLTAPTGKISAGGALTLNAVDRVTLNDSLTTGGALTINADTDANGVGSLIVAANQSITTTNNALSIKAAFLSMKQSQTLNSGTAAATIEASAGETIGLNDASENLTLDASHIFSGALILGGSDLNTSATGSIVVGPISVAQSRQIGPVTLTAGSTALSAADITFSGAAEFASAGAGRNAIAAQAAHDINVNAAITTTNVNPANASNPGDVDLEAQNLLTMNAGGSITTTPGAGGTLTIGGAVSAHDVTVGAGNVTLVAHATSADLTISGTITSGGSIILEAQRDIIVEATVQTTTATADITLTADDANTGTGGVWITAVGNLNAGRNVIISGSNLFNRSLPGGFTPALPAGTPLSIEVANNTDVTPTNPVVAAGNITIENSSVAPAGAVIDLNGIVQSTGAGAISLTAAALAQAGQYAIQTSSTIESNGGDISVDSHVILTGATTFATTGSGSIAFNKTPAGPGPNATIDSFDATPQALNLTAGMGGITLSAAVGANHAVGTLTANSANGVTFNADVTTNAALNVNADTDANGVGAFTLAVNKNITTNGNALHVKAASMILNQNQTLDSGTAATTIEASAGETIGLNDASGNLTLDASDIFSGALILGGSDLNTSMTGSIVVGPISVAQSRQIGPVTLTAGSTALSAADITFSGASEFASSGAGHNAIAAQAAHDINVNAAITTTNVNPANASNPGDVDLEAQNQLTMNVGGSITTTPGGGGTLTISGVASVHDVMVGAGNVTLVAHAASADLTITGTISAGTSIVLDAQRDIIIEGTVQTTTATADITLTADEANTGTGGVWITAIGNLNSGRNIIVSGSNLFHRSLPGGFTPGLPAATPLSIEVANNTNATPANPIVAFGNISIEDSSVAPAGAVIDLNGVVQSTGAGDIALTAAQQASQYVIQTNSTIESAGGNISVDSPVVLTGDTTFDGVNVTFAQTLNADVAVVSSNLTANASGITMFGGAVGGIHALSSLTTDAAGSTQINGGLVTTTADQTYNDAVTINEDTTLNGMNVTFAQTLDADVAAVSSNLTVNASGVTTFGGAVGGIHALASLTTDSPGSTQINGGLVTTTADQTYNDTVTIKEDTTLNGVNVTFTQTLDADPAAASSNLTVNASEDVAFTGAVGFLHPLGALSVASSHDFVESAGIEAKSVNVNGTNDVTFTGSVTTTLAGAGAMTAFAGHDINVNGAIKTTAGDVDLEAQNQLTMNAGGSITTTPGSGGKLTITGAVFAHDITVGAGNVTLVGLGTGADLIISGPIIGGVPIILQAPRDIIVEAMIQTTTATADITLIADQNHTGLGGVWITAKGNLLSGRNVLISGSNLFNRSLPGGFTPDLPAGTPLSIEVANNTEFTPTNPIVAAGNITIENSSVAPAGAAIDLNGVVQSTGTGTISLTAATLAHASQYVIQTNSTIESAGGTIKFDSLVILTGATTVDSTDGGAAAGGDITFTGSATIDSQSGEHNSVTLDAGTASVFFNANLGQTQSLGALTVTQANSGVTFGQTDTNMGAGGTGPVTVVNTDGPIDLGAGADVIGGTGIVFNGGANPLAITTTGESVRLNGAVTLQSAVTINTDAGDTDAQGGNITFTSNATVDSQNGEHNDLTLDAGTAGVFFNANLGQTQSLGALTVTEASSGVTFGQTDSNTGNGGTGPVTVVNTDGPIDLGVGADVIGGTGIVFNGRLSPLAISTTGDSVRLNGAVTLQSAVTINTDAGDTDAQGGNITFTSNATVDSQSNEHNDLTLDAGTAGVLFNANLGQTQSLGSLTVFEASSGVTFGQTDSNTGAGGTGPVTIVNTDGPIDLGVGADVIGGTGIVFNGGSNSLAITTTGDSVRMNGAVTLQSAVTINTDAGDTDAQGGNISFTSNSTVDSQSNEHNDLTLDVGTAGVLFNANLGQTQSLGALTVLEANSGVTFGQTDSNTGNGGTGPVTVVNTDGPIDLGVGADVIGGTGIVFNGGSNPLAITTTGDSVRLNGAVTLQSAVTISTDGGDTDAQGGNITFTSNATVDSQSNEHNDLTLDAGTAGVLFNANLGQTQSLGALTVLEANSGVTFGQTDVNTGNGGTGPVTVVSTVGAININTAVAGIPTTGDILVNNAVITSAGADVTLTAGNIVNTAVAGGNVVFGPHGQIQSSGGAITITAIHSPNTGAAQGQIVMADGSIINALTGAISLNATGDIHLAHVSTTTAVPVHIQSQLGRIANSGNSAGHNIDAPNVELEGMLGIGSGTPLLTGISMLAAVNTTSGNIQLINDVASGQGQLIIGLVGSTVGIHNTGGGNVFVSNNGALFADKDVMNFGGGNITLITTTGGGHNLTTNARIYSEGGNGDIILRAGNNLVLNDTGFTPDIMTTSGYSTSGNVSNPGTGKILGTAANVVHYGAHVMLQTDQGWNVPGIWNPEVSSITTLSPNLFNVAAPQIKVDGSASITGHFGDPGAHDFKLLVDWHDGTIDTYYASNPGTFQFFHHYTHFPNTIVESAPIPISVTVISDPNIQLIGKLQLPITTIIDNSAVIPGEKDLQTLGNGFAGSHASPNAVLDGLLALQNNLISILNFGFVFANSTEFTGPQTSNFLTFASVPGNGLGLISIDSNIEISAVHQSVNPSASNSITSAPVDSTQSQAEMGVARTEDTSTVEERQVVVELLDENDNVLSTVKMKESILDNLDELFDTLKNGRYRISVIEPGESEQRTLLEVNLRGGKPAPEMEEGEKPPTIDDADVGADEAGVILPADADGDDPQVERRHVPQLASRLALSEEIHVRAPLVPAPFVGEPSSDSDPAAARPVSDRDADGSGQRSHANRALAGASLGLGALAACALANSVGTSTWEERIDAALAAADAGALSKSARLARRLRQREKQARIPSRRRGRV